MTEEIAMRTAGLTLAACLALSALGCGATTSSTASGSTTTAAAPTLTNASVTFVTRDDGKDGDSAVTVQLLDESSRLMSEGTVANISYDDKTVSPPLSLSITQPLAARGLDDARLRLRLTPDGRDRWTFDVRLVLGLSDGTQRNYFFGGLALDENAPERVLPLSSGRLP
jgi:hypothetical protein